jgi:hypothetical protein
MDDPLMAEELRAGATMPLEWIARRLQMGSRGCLTRLLQQRRRKTQKTKAGKHANTIN